MKDVLKQLIKFKTLSRETETNKKALEWVNSQVPEKYERKIKEYNGYPSLLVGSKSPLLCLQAHIDVVPGEEKDFEPQEERGILYGRGTYDMKFAIACFLEILKNLNPQEHDIGMLITSDEEIGGFNGVGALVKDGYSPGFTFLPDGGDDWNFDKKAKGAWHLEINAEGISGHASRPWEGESANHKLLDILEELRGHFPQIEKEEFKPTINIGKIEGGKATNQISESASSKVDIRFTSNEEKEEIEKKLKEIEARYKGVSMKEDVFAPLFECDTESPHFKEFENIAAEHETRIGRKFSHGATDARHFSAQGISTMVIKPRGGGSHSKEEWVDLEDLERFRKITEKFAKKISKKG